MNNTLTDKQEKALFEVAKEAYNNFTSAYKKKLLNDFGIDCAYDYMDRIVLYSIDNLTEVC